MQIKLHNVVLYWCTFWCSFVLTKWRTGWFCISVTPVMRNMLEDLRYKDDEWPSISLNYVTPKEPFFSKLIKIKIVTESNIWGGRRVKNGPFWHYIIHGQPLILFNTCFTEAWWWSILNIDYKVHPNLMAICSTGHIEAIGILLHINNLSSFIEGTSLASLVTIATDKPEAPVSPVGPVRPAGLGKPAGQGRVTEPVRLAGPGSSLDIYESFPKTAPRNVPG